MYDFFIHQFVFWRALQGNDAAFTPRVDFPAGEEGFCRYLLKNVMDELGWDLQVEIDIRGR